MTLNRMPENFFAESEQIAFGTGVLVDGLDFSDDKMLVGRTFSYSDTQRYRVGPNYLQLPVNQAKNARVATNQRDGQMAYGVDLGPGQNPHVNYEPSITGGLREADVPHARRAGPGDHRPAHPQADPAHRRLHAGRPALPAVRAVGEGRPGGQPGRRPLAVRPPDPGADGLAPVHGRGRAGPARRRGHRHQRRRRPWPAAAADPDAHRGRAAACGQPRQERPARRQRPDHDALRAERARRPRAADRRLEHHSTAGGPRPGGRGPLCRPAWSGRAGPPGPGVDLRSPSRATTCRPAPSGNSRRRSAGSPRCAGSPSCWTASTSSSSAPWCRPCSSRRSGRSPARGRRSSSRSAWSA